MASAIAARIDLWLANGVEHFMVDDEGEKIFGDGSIVEERMDQDLMPMAVVGAEGDVAKTAPCTAPAPSDRGVVIGGEKFALNPLVDRSQIVKTP